jgi:glutathione synthase/RimK-type ligase-like ATP-grasp enzyme
LTLVLLWGILEDNTLSTVYDALQRANTPVIFIDQYDLLSTKIELQVSSDGVVGFLRSAANQVIDLGLITGAYLRPYNLYQLVDITNTDVWQHAINVDESLSCWAELTNALVINKTRAMTSNNSKPYQAAQIQSSGFEVPDTLITTDPKAALKFWRQQGAVIYKSISSTRSIVSRLTSEHIDRLADVVWCPTQFQQYIPGIDYRVHVVGDEVFACQIISKADDYRYAARQGESIHIIPSDLPEDISYKCKALTKEMGLIVAGLDLRITPDDKWYCFEVNPSPAFTYYQQTSEHAIDEAIANLLTME